MKEYSLGNVIRAGALGALLGGAAGFTLGIVLAPERGQQLRRRMAYRLEHLGEQLGAFLEQAISPEVDTEARRSGDAVVEDARTRAQHIRNDIDALIGEIRRQAPSRPSAAGEQ
ncbi:MAG TPA: YtxH domain-containing protein [Rhodothermales bacterium]|nr:YtxH domain-containing protein [Rhodothermales bacterium]